MRTPRRTVPCFARRSAVIVAAVAATATIAACRSDRDAVTTTTSTSTTTTSTTTSTTTTTTTLPPTTTTTPPVTSPGVVKVANASGVDGAAGRLSDELAALGFQLRDPTNAAGAEDDLDVSKIYVLPGSEAVAYSISRLMGGLEVLPMPTPAWIRGGSEALGDTTVLVMLGHDLASTPLADMAG